MEQNYRGSSRSRIVARGVQVEQQLRLLARVWVDSLPISDILEDLNSISPVGWPHKAFCCGHDCSLVVGDIKL